MRSPSADASGSTTSAVQSTTTTIPPVQPVLSPSYSGDAPFALGVASGDPDDTSVVLWTRLRVDPFSPGGFAEADLEIAVDVARDDGFSDLVHSALHAAPSSFDHSVHALVEALDPDSWYWYRFRLGDHTSAIGRTRTTPSDGDTPLRLGFSSCQNWESGSYAAHRHLATTDLDLFVWLGDYIYEYGPGNQGDVGSAGSRVHTSPEVTNLAGYRERYALYKSDPSLQAHHAARPWIVTWDDHEIDNNYAGLSSEDGQDPDGFVERRRDAHLAWWENMPVRLDPPTADRFEIHRTIRWGSLAHLHMLDGRQYRDAQPTDGDPVILPVVGDLGVRTLAETARDPNQSMLGPEQRQWLENEVSSSQPSWNILGNQVYMHGLDAFPGAAPATNTDTWDGYHGERLELLTNLTSSSDNLVILSGDFHSATAADVRADPFDLSGPIIATEFMAPAISSSFPELLRDLAPLVVGFNPQVRHFEPDNGFMTCEVTPTRWTTELHRLVDVTAEDSDIAVTARFTVRAGSPGIATVELSE